MLRVPRGKDTIKHVEDQDDPQLEPERRRNERSSLLGNDPMRFARYSASDVLAGAVGSSSSEGLDGQYYGENRASPAKVPNRVQKTRVLFLLSIVLSFIGGWGVRGILKDSTDILDPAVRQRIRISWDKQYQQHQDQVSKMQDITEKWAKEIEAHQSARLAMQKERQEWDQTRKEEEKISRQRQELELEKERREREKEREEEEKKKVRLTWGEVQPDAHCLRFGTRKYTAKLENIPEGYDPTLACKETKALIHDRWVAPDVCDNKGAWNGIIGTWFVDFDEAGCHSFWNGFNDKGCTANGSGKRHIESRLENIRPGDDPMIMCSSTPAEFNGLKFDGPDSCNYWGIYGYWGIWFVEDGDCR